MVKVPVRVAPVLASKLKITVASLAPLSLPAARCSHGSVVAAVQTPPAASSTESLPAAGPSVSEETPREYVPAWAVGANQSAASVMAKMPLRRDGRRR
jgi:hypothetical protein